MNVTEGEKINVCEDIVIGSQQTKVYRGIKHKTKQKKILHQNIRKLWNNTQLSDIRVVGIAEILWGRKIF